MVWRPQIFEKPSDTCQVLFGWVVVSVGTPMEKLLKYDRRYGLGKSGRAGRDDPERSCACDESEVREFGESPVRLIRRGGHAQEAQTKLVDGRSDRMSSRCSSMPVGRV